MKIIKLAIILLAITLALGSCTDGSEPDVTDGRIDAPSDSSGITADTRDSGVTTKPTETDKPADTDDKPSDTTDKVDKPADTDKPDDASPDLFNLDFDSLADMIKNISDKDKVADTGYRRFYSLGGLPDGFSEVGCRYNTADGDYEITYKADAKVVTVSPMSEKALRSKLEDFALTNEFSAGGREFKFSAGSDGDGNEYLEIFVFDGERSYFMTFTGIIADNDTIAATSLSEFKPAGD